MWDEIYKNTQDFLNTGFKDSQGLIDNFKVFRKPVYLDYKTIKKHHLTDLYEHLNQANIKYYVVQNNPFYFIGILLFVEDSQRDNFFTNQVTEYNKAINQEVRWN